MKGSIRYTNTISSIQKNLKSMQEEAQHYIQKHQSILPPICKARHYLLNSFSKIGVDLNPQYSPTNFSPHASPQKEQAIHPKKTICSIQFTQDDKNEKIAESSTVIMNCTSLKLKERDKRQQKRQEVQISRRSVDVLGFEGKEKMKTIIMNSQTVKITDNKINVKSKRYTPRIRKLDLSKQPQEILSKYLSQFRQQKIINKQIDDLSKQLIEPKNEHIKKRVKRKFITIDHDLRNIRKRKVSQQKRKNSLFQIKGNKAEEFQYTPWAHDDNYHEEDFEIN